MDEPKPTTKTTPKTTGGPTEEPDAKPTAEPDAGPTEEPTEEPTAGPDAEPTEESDAGPHARRRVRALGLLLTLGLLALPMLVVSSLLSPPHAGEVVSGSQPGGLVEGSVRDPEGELLAGHEVILMLVPSAGEPTQGAVVHTDATGKFSFQAPPLEGKYRLIAGGGLLARTFLEITMVNAEGRALTLEPVDLDLEPGALLRIVLEREDGLPVTGGTLLLQGTTTGQGLFGLLSYGIRLEHDFEGNTCEVGGLPPLKGNLTIRLLSGDMVVDEVTLPAGSTTRTYRL